jgi:hypothetical protein
VGLDETRRLGESIRGCDLDQDLPAIVEHHRQQIVRQHFVRDLRNPREHGADVEDVGDRPQQFHRGFDARCARPLDRGAARRFREPLVGDSDGHVARQPLDQGQILRRVRARTPREQCEHPDNGVANEDGRAHPRSKAPLKPGHRIHELGRDRLPQDARLLTTHEIWSAFARAGIQTELRAVVGGEREVPFIVRQDARGDRAEVLKHVPDIQ